MMDRPPLKPNTIRCRCAACSRSFRSPEDFDLHFRLTETGAVLCQNPADIGMVYVVGFWTLPTDRRDAGSDASSRPPRPETSKQDLLHQGVLAL